MPDVVPPSTPAGGTSRAANRGSPSLVLTAAAAQLCAWCVLAIINQVLIGVLLHPVALRVRMLHHALDAGQLVALGLLSFGGVKLAEFITARAGLSPRRRRWVHAASLAAAVFVVSMLIVAEDVGNFARRHELHPLLVSIAASCTFTATLTSTLLFRRIQRGWLRALPLLCGAAIVVANALVLDGGYVAVHFMLAWLGALLIGHAVEGFDLPRLGERRSRLAFGVLAVGAVTAVAVRPRSDVLRRLYSLPSSVAAPFFGSFMPEQSGPSIRLVPAEYRQSPWFAERIRAASVPPTGALQMPESPIVIFLTIDALRADVLEQRKYDKYLPQLNELRKTSIYFTQARTPAPGTTMTMASVFTGRYYSQLSWGKNGKMDRVLDEMPRFPALLSDAGVETLHVTTMGRLREVHGVASGFTTEHWIPMSWTRGADSVAAMIAHIDGGAPGPLFIYAHFIEPHAPYDLAGKKGSPFDRYVREIGIVDKQIGRLRRHLRKEGLEKNTMLIVSADHGEAFGEHGTEYHAKTLYEELLRVPLIVHMPGLPARDIHQPVTLMDIGPTVLDAFGLSTPGWFMAESLMPLIAGRPTQLTRPLVADSDRGLQAFYMKDHKKVIIDRKRHTVEVYDLQKDQGELANLVESGEPAIAAAVETAKLFFQVHTRTQAGQTPLSDSE